MKKKQMEYTLEIKFWFDIDDPINIKDYFNKFEEIGEIKIIDSKIIEIED